ncbi:MAG: Asp-tRNA(Asn)/Glu-tRNA(Gln) amidotransferase subunit GatC [Gammaproteobacteria bacterium]|nr:Asp-tRNA(Asn)/Glu-tRNA(Gln) amidotransferase subunit GatC [Gammaproteobacteria bacterium]
MPLNKSEVGKIALLAKLHVNDTDVDEIADRITEILSLIDQMQTIDTESVEPMSHPLDAVQILREDVVTETNHRDELQKLAPKAENGLYLVPQVLD